MEPSPPVTPEPLAVVQSGTARRTRELALVLHSQGIASRVIAFEGAFALQVREAEAARASEILAIYEEENRPQAVPPPPPPPAPLALESAVLVALSMAGFYAVTGPRDAGDTWFATGSADAVRIAMGETWRIVTALTLHADAPHLIANLMFGTLFLALLGRSLGPGLALLGAVAAGAGGNLVNALVRSGDHVSVGASTAVFGAVGLLCGVGIVVRRRGGERWRRVVLPVAGGLGLLAMLGSGEGRVDVFAHLFGLLVGIPIGALAAWMWPRAPGLFAQCVYAALAAVLLVGSWTVAMSSVPVG